MATRMMDLSAEVERVVVLSHIFIFQDSDRRHETFLSNSNHSDTVPVPAHLLF